MVFYASASLRDRVRPRRASPPGRAAARSGRQLGAAAGAGADERAGLIPSPLVASPRPTRRSRRRVIPRRSPARPLGADPSLNSTRPS